jgi:hypothetical protein
VQAFVIFRKEDLWKLIVSSKTVTLADTGINRNITTHVAGAQTAINGNLRRI